jgi:M6 family metalloprotease-like protein
METRQLALIACLLFLRGSVSFCAPPRNPSFLKNLHAGFRTDYTLSPEQLKSLQSRGAIRKAGQRGLALSTTYKILVIRVDFTDAGYQMTKVSTDVAKFFNDLRDYYYENSYGIVTVTATVTARTLGGSAGSLGAYKLGTIDTYNDESDLALKTLLIDSLTAAKDDYDLTQFNHIMVYHAGAGHEESGVPKDIWSLFSNMVVHVGTATFNGFTTVPDTSADPTYSPLAVICHEYGHQLGLFDLYDTSVTGGRTTCGSWSLMDFPYGADGTGKHPPHLDPCGKNFLKFIDLNTIIVNAVTPKATLYDSETSQTTGFFKIPIDVATDTEYFIVEYRRPDETKMKFDLSLPATGVLIWHIDDTIALDPTRQTDNTINTGTPNLGIDLVEADGIPISKNQPGKPGDAWGPGKTFTEPQSNAFNGKLSGVVLANFVLNGSATFSITKIAAAAILSAEKVITYPNPAGPKYPSKNNSTLTTFSLVLSRPPKNLTLSIYDIAGELVRQVSGASNFSLKINASQDLKWVYEYDWDGKNDHNEAVASGLYYYRIKADNEIKTSKLAIVR